MGLERVAPASRPPNPPVIRTLWRMMVTQLVTPAADRPFPQARGLGHRLQPAVPQFEGFAGRPAAPSSLIEIRLKAGELSSEDFDNASVYHVINVVQIDEIGQLFIYDDLLDAGADLAFVKDWLGHANIQNTTIYARLTTATLDSTARKVFASHRVV